MSTDPQMAFREMLIKFHREANWSSTVAQGKAMYPFLKSDGEWIKEWFDALQEEVLPLLEDSGDDVKSAIWFVYRMVAFIALKTGISRNMAWMQELEQIHEDFEVSYYVPGTMRSDGVIFKSIALLAQTQR